MNFHKRFPSISHQFPINFPSISSISIQFSMKCHQIYSHRSPRLVTQWSQPGGGRRLPTGPGTIWRQGAVHAGGLCELPHRRVMLVAQKFLWAIWGYIYINIIIYTYIYIHLFIYLFNTYIMVASIFFVYDYITWLKLVLVRLDVGLLGDIT